MSMKYKKDLVIPLLGALVAIDNKANSNWFSRILTNGK